jgi:hypothetical protein
MSEQAKKKFVVDNRTHARNEMPLQQQSNRHHNTKGCLLHRLTHAPSNTIRKKRTSRDEHKKNTMANDNSSKDTCNNAQNTHCTNTQPKY